jgi:hypothetical protein
MRAVCITAGLLAILAGCSEDTVTEPAAIPDLAGTWTQTVDPAPIPLSSGDTVFLNPDTTFSTLTLDASDSTYTYVNVNRTRDTTFYESSGTWTVPDASTLKLMPSSCSAYSQPVTGSALSTCQEPIVLGIKSDTKLTLSVENAASIYELVGVDLDPIRNDPNVGSIVMGSKGEFTKQ